MNLFNELTKTQQLYVESIRTIGGAWGYDLTKRNWTRKELVAISMIRQGNDDVPNWIVKDKARRVGRGVYSIPEISDVNPGTHQVDHGSPIHDDGSPIHDDGSPIPTNGSAIPNDEELLETTDAPL